MKRGIFFYFEKCINYNHEIPIEILIDPYLKQLNTYLTYNLWDFLFFKNGRASRIESVNNIIGFILNLCLNNVMFSRIVNLTLSLIFKKNNSYEN